MAGRPGSRVRVASRVVNRGAGHDRVVNQSGIIRLAGLVKLRACKLEADVPGGSWDAVQELLECPNFRPGVMRLWVGNGMMVRCAGGVEA